MCVRQQHLQNSTCNSPSCRTTFQPDLSLDHRVTDNEVIGEPTSTSINNFFAKTHPFENNDLINHLNLLATLFNLQLLCPNHLASLSTPSTSAPPGLQQPPSIQLPQQLPGAHLPGTHLRSPKKGHKRFFVGVGLEGLK